MSNFTQVSPEFGRRLTEALAEYHMVSVCLSLIIICILCLLFSTHFLGAERENFFNNQELSLVHDNFLYSCGLNV